MKYLLVLDEPFDIGDGTKTGTGCVCDFEAETPINKGDRIEVPIKGTSFENYKNLDERELIILKVIRSPRHIIKEGKVETIAVFTKRVD